MTGASMSGSREWCGWPAFRTGGAGGRGKGRAEDYVAADPLPKIWEQVDERIRKEQAGIMTDIKRAQTS